MENNYGLVHNLVNVIVYTMYNVLHNNCDPRIARCKAVIRYDNCSIHFVSFSQIQVGFVGVRGMGLGSGMLYSLRWQGRYVWERYLYYS